MAQTKIEFAVQMKDEKCKEYLQKVLDGSGTIEIDVERGRVLVETQMPWSVLMEKLEATGRKVALTGFSGGQSAVSIISTTPSPNLDIKGVIRFCSLEKGAVIDGVVDGLEANKSFTLNINECGDITKCCDSIGAELHSNIIETNDKGRSTFRFINNDVDVGQIIGRSVSITNGLSNEKLGYGIIARASGIFQNYKRICACDGVTIWNEKI